MPFKAQMFLGFLVCDAFESQLRAAPKPLRESLIAEGRSEYLCQVNFDGQLYLGKLVDEETSIAALELLETHIYSLLQKLVPKHPYKQAGVHLFSFITPLNDLIE